MSCMSLHDMMQKIGSLTAGKRTSLNFMSIREEIERSRLQLRWVPTRHMLAGFLTTKMEAPPYLVAMLRKGLLSLVESTEAKKVVNGLFLHGDSKGAAAAPKAKAKSKSKT